MNDVNNRIFYEFSEFLKETESVPPEMRVSLAYEITIKSTIASALIDLASENKLDERYWNHLRVQRNILDFLYALWLDDNRTLVGEFSTILKDLVEYDFSIADEHMKERLSIYTEFEQRRLASLPQMRHHRNGCRCDSGRESLSLRISGLPRQNQRYH